VCHLSPFELRNSLSVLRSGQLKAAIPRGGLGSQRIMLEAHYIAPRSIRCGGFFLFWGRDSGKKMRY
jgi:hypothetical protein